tara:strand:+ start:4160 stop:8644 length:4485 start_codon:yes stop_codon:yes gene_type:complete
MSSIVSLEELLADSEETTGTVGKPPLDPTSPIEIQAVEEQSLLLEVDPAVISEARLAEDMTHEGLSKQFPDLNVFLETLYSAGVPVEEAGRLAQEHVDRKQIAVSPREFIFSSIMMVDDDTVNQETLRMLTNYELINKRIAERLEKNDPSTFKWIAAGTMNTARDFTIGVFEMLIRKDAGKSKEYADTLLMEPEEFDAYWDAELDDAETKGIFNIREYESLRDVQVLIDNYGTDENAGFNQLLALADVATMGITKVAGRVVAAGGRKLITGTASTAETVAGVLKARSASEVITATKGDVAGAKATVVQINTGNAPNSVSGKAGPTTLDLNPSTPVPQAATVIEGTKASMLFDEMSRIMASPFAGKAFSRESLQEATQKVATRLMDSSTNAFVKVSRRRAEGSDNYIYSAVLGKSENGAAFATRKEAVEAVGNDPRYKPIRRNADDLEQGYGLKENKRGWYLEYEERIDTSRLAKEIEDVTIDDGFVKRAAARLFSAGQTTVGPRIGFMINAAEGIVSRVSKLADQSFKDINKLSKAEGAEVNKVMTRYRDKPIGDTDTNLAAQRGAPSSEQFATDFYQINGKMATEKQLTAYRALTDFNNAAWNVKATEILKTVANRGGWSVTIDQGYDGIGVITKVADDAVVYSRLQGRIQGSRVGERVVYKLDQPYQTPEGKMFEYVTDVVDARVPQKSDVLGYNVGGSRNNEGLNFFIGSIYQTTLAGGKKSAKGFRTLLGSFSAKEADKAAREINNIVDVLAPIFKATGIKSISKLDISGDDLVRVNAVIAANNSWNPSSIKNFGDLKLLAGKQKEDFTAKFEVKRRDQQVDAEIVDGQGMSVGEYQSMRVSRKRGDTPLLEYGGARVGNQEPITNILEQFQSTAYRYTHYKATQAAVNGWVQKAKRLGNVEFEGGVIPSQPEDFVRLANIKGGKGSKSVDADMMDQQAVIKRRLGLHDRADKENTLYTMFSQSIYDEGVFGLGKGLKTKPEDWIGGAAGRARAFAFHLKMGFLNPDQMVLNASHVAQIMAISPKAGAKATAAVPVIVHLMLKTPKAAAKDIDSMYSNGFAGMSKQELLDTVRYMRESGRDIIGTSVLERSGATFNKNAGVASEALEMGLTPFKMGELYGRIASAATAVVEHGARKVSDDVFSEKGLQYVANREQVLSFRMTSGQKGAYQEGPILGLATQWMSYTNRFLDNILIGRDLSKGERARMLATNTVLFGTRGMGFPPRVTAAMVAMGIDPEDQDSTAALNAVKFGLFDWVLSQGVGTDVSLGTRIAPLGGLVQQYSELFAEDPVWSTLTGPSGQIGTEGFKSLRNTLSALIGGHNQVAAEEFTVMMRNVKSVDIYAKVVELIETGEYRSKRRSLAGAFSEEEVNLGFVASIIGGSTPMKVLNHYDAKDISYKEDAKFKDARNRIDRWASKGLALIETGEPAKIEEGGELYTDAMNLIEDGGFSVENQTKLYRAIVRLDTMADLIKRARGQSAGSQITAQAAQGE